MSGPLAGIRVLELGTLIAAPFASRIFAEFGAQVVKVEPPGGDPLRKWRKLYKGTSLWWYLQSRNKQSIALDLKTPEGIDIVRKLAAECDVIIENFRPGALEKLGLGWETLSAANPKLVMVRISGFGQSGPYRDRPGFGAIGEAMGGIRYTTGEPGLPPARVGVSLGDSLASLHGVIGALMALLHVKSDGDRHGRRKCGQCTEQLPAKGQVVDVSLFESVFNVMESLVPEYDLLKEVRERSGGSLPGIAPSNTYATASGEYVVIAGNSDLIFQRLMNVIGRPDLATAPDLRSNEGRVARVAEIDAAITHWTTGLKVEDVLRALDAAEVPASRIYSVADIVSDPHYQARGMIEDVVLPDGQKVRMPGIVPKLLDTPGETRWLGPKLGEHTDAILERLGYDAATIDALRKKGVLS
jgi:crotonobetainyl-CoA:carnitine CoA-transferase CaiB-like acyl-CoA transferase